MRRRESMIYLIGLATSSAKAVDVRFSAAEVAPPQFLSGIQASIAEVLAGQPSERLVVPPGVDTPLAFSSLFVNELDFRPEGRLVFTGLYGKFGEKIIVARRLIIQASTGSEAPPVIGWARGGRDALPAAVQAGKAPSAWSTRFPGERAQSGLPGVPGNAGFPGRDAPNLVLVVREVVARGPLRIDLRGQDGGRGGDGQIGGDGAAGRPGIPGISMMLGCKGIPFNGADGGDAGAGGAGGQGGRGGSGGSLVIVGEEPRLKELEPHILVEVDPGERGPFGKGGAPGQPGAGGAGATAFGNCTGVTAAGRPGQKASPGADGLLGLPGAPGDVRSFILSPEVAAALKL